MIALPPTSLGLRIMDITAHATKKELKQQSKSCHGSPVDYLERLFGAGKLTIYRKDIRVRSERLIDSVATRYGYVKQLSEAGGKSRYTKRAWTSLA